MFPQKNHKKSLAIKAGEIKLTPRTFNAEKLNVLQVCVNPLAFTKCIKN